MPGGSPKSRVEPDSDHRRAAQAQTAEDSQEEAKAPGGSMAARRGKSGLPQSASRSELRVYKAGSSEGRLPVPTNLRKQKSLTNLCVLTDAEKKMHLYQPKWSDDMAKPGPGYGKTGKPKDGGGGAGRGSVGGGGGGHAALSRKLSKSEHSLCPGKSKSFSQLVPPSQLAKPSRLPRGPYAEVKPISKAQEAAKDSKSDDEILTSKAKVNGKKGATSPSGAATNGGGGGKGQEGEEGNKAFVKVDPELVVTVLGDLEQLLFSQILGEYRAALLFCCFPKILLLPLSTRKLCLLASLLPAYLLKYLPASLRFLVLHAMRKTNPALSAWAVITMLPSTLRHARQSCSHHHTDPLLLTSKNRSFFFCAMLSGYHLVHLFFVCVCMCATDQTVCFNFSFQESLSLCLHCMHMRQLSKKLGETN